MFVRKKRNRSGTTTIVVVNKRHGKFEEVRNFGTAKTESEVSELYSKAQHWLNTNGGQQSIDFEDLKGRELEATERFFENIDSVLINGTQLLLGQVYDSIGFNRTGDEVLRHLVIARVSQPMSKLATVEYLKSYYDEDVDLNRIYRYMDRLYKTQQELVQPGRMTCVSQVSRRTGRQQSRRWYSACLSAREVIRFPTRSSTGASMRATR